MEDPSERIDAKVKESAAGEVRVHDAVGGAVFLGDVVAEGAICYDAVHGAEVAALDKSADSNTEREVPCPDGFHEEEIFFSSEADEFFELHGVGGKDLLAEDIFPRGEGEHAILVMMGVWGGDVDAVDVGVLDEGFIGAVGGGRGRDVQRFDEVIGTRSGSRGRNGRDDMGNIGYGSRGRVDQQVFDEGFGDTASCWN